METEKLVGIILNMKMMKKATKNKYNKSFTIDNYVIEYYTYDNELIFYDRKKFELGFYEKICFIYVRDKIDKYKEIIDNDNITRIVFGDLVLSILDDVLFLHSHEGNECIKITEIRKFREYLAQKINYIEYLRSIKLDDILE